MNVEGLVASVALIVSLGMAGGCSKANQPAPVRIGYFANATQAQAVLGVASGDFARAVAPSKLETKVFNAGPSLVEALFAGEIDIGYVGPGPTITAHARSRGQGIRVIAGAAANGVVIVARKESDIHAIGDLAGRRIATPQLGNTQDISARHFLTYALHQPDTKNILPIENAQQGAMLARGEIDAAWAPEPWGQRLIQEQGARLVAEEKDLWPGKEMGLTLVVTTPEFLAGHSDVVEQFLAAHRTWTNRLQTEPEKHVGELGDALYALTGRRLAEGELPAALQRVKFTDEPPDATLGTFATWMFDLGFSHREIDTQRLVDTTILRRLSGAVAERQELR